MSMSDTNRSSSFNTPSGSSSTSGAGQTGRSAVSSLKDSVGEAVVRGKTDLADSTQAVRDSFAQDYGQLKADLARMQETLAKFAGEAGSTAASTAKNVGQAVASQVGSAASELAASATEQAKTFASELESMARKNPLGTLAGTLVVGVLLGMMSRGGRS